MISLSKKVSFFSLLSLGMLIGCGQGPNKSEEVQSTAIQPVKTCELDFPKLGLCSTLQWTRAPRVGLQGAASMRFTNKTAAGSPQLSQRYYLQAYLQVPIQPNFFVTYNVQQYLDPDYFTLAGLDLNYPGNYQLTIQVKDGGGQVVDQAVKAIIMTDNGIKSECPYDFSALKLCSSLAWKSGPKIGATNSFEFKSWDYNANLTGPYTSPSQTLRAIVWNSDKKIQEKDAVVTKSQEGVYQVTGVNFSAAGNYEIWLQFVFPNGQIQDQVKSTVTL